MRCQERAEKPQASDLGPYAVISTYGPIFLIIIFSSSIITFSIIVLVTMLLLTYFLFYF